jgi:FtsZ-interacting cell division protein ZipA
MSELQAALLAIGFGVIVAVYAFGWWQQRQYRRKFGSVFKSAHRDALYQPDVLNRAHDAGQAPQPLASVMDEALEDTAAAESAPGLQNGPCELLDGSCDFIIELRLNEPSPAGVLEGLWQRKFDFGKPVQVCGLTLVTKRWERAIAEGQTLYARFRIALQLVDRGGMVSAAKLADFRDLVLGVAKHIKADTTVPDVDETSRRAVELDAFCAEVDQMAGVNLMPRGERSLIGRDILQAAALQDMTLESDGAFHFLDAQGHSQFSLINRDSKPFQHHMLETFSTAGVTLLLDVPRVEDPGKQFDRMMRVARDLAKDLRVHVVDDHRVELTDNGLALIHARIAAVEAKMRAHGIEPGSAQALRLFA